MKEETNYSDEGDSVNVKKCPHCKAKLVVRMKSGNTEVLTCNNCKFEVKKK